MTRNTNADIQSATSSSTNRRIPIAVSHHTANGPSDLGTSVVMAIAECLDVDPLELTPPLNEILDPDALDSLFDSVDDNAETSLTFSEWGCTITVHSNGRILVEPDG